MQKHDGTTCSEQFCRKCVEENNISFRPNTSNENKLAKMADFACQDCALHCCNISVYCRQTPGCVQHAYDIFAIFKSGQPVNLYCKFDEIVQDGKAGLKRFSNSFIECEDQISNMEIVSLREK